MSHACCIFYFLFFILNSSSSPVDYKTGFLPRVPTRQDLPLNFMKFNEFFVVLIGIERYEESTSLFCKSTIQSHILFFWRSNHIIYFFGFFKKNVFESLFFIKLITFHSNIKHFWFSIHETHINLRINNFPTNNFHETYNFQFSFCTALLTVWWRKQHYARFIKKIALPEKSLQLHMHPKTHCSFFILLRTHCSFTHSIVRIEIGSIFMKM